MRGGIRGWWPLAAIALLLAAGSWVLYAVWQAPNRNDLIAYGGFAVTVVTLTAAWIASAWRARARRVSLPAAGPDLDHVADLLAVAVKTQWEQAAGERGLADGPIAVTWGRPSRPVAGPAAAAAGSRRFAPLPGLTPAGEAQLAAGQIGDLHAVYGGLGSGRLLVAGAPGSGKTGAAVLLVLAALQHRDRVGAEDRVKVPVPVLLTAQDWDPRREPVREWLTGRLQQTYPLLAGQMGAANAGGLIDAGRIAVIVDGLDEIAADLRPVALQALSQASFRVVVMSRTAEMASAASQRGVLPGAAAIELRVVDPATAADYLERVQLDPPPEGWRDLIGRIRASPASALTEALNSPLALTLIRDTYQSGDDARELLDQCDAIQKRVSGVQAAEEITGHLLDRVLPAAYAPRSGQPPSRYDLQTAQNALAKIAARMNQDSTRDLQWWHIPRWVPSAPRIVAIGLAVGLVAGFVSILVAGLQVGLGVGLGFGLEVGLLGGLVFGVMAGLAALGTSGPPAGRGRIGRPRLRRVFTRRSLKFGLIAGLAVGLAAGLAGGLTYGLTYRRTDMLTEVLVAGLYTGVAFGLTTGLVGVLAVGLANAFEDPDNTSPLSPAISWRNDLGHATAIGLMVWLVTGVVGGLVYGFLYGLIPGLEAGLIVGAAAGLVSGLGISHVLPAALAAAQLARRWHTPLRLMDFLDDARERNVLRTVGPVYQFRHARLQDRLAAAAPHGPDNSRTGQSFD
jgi:hypothetical protein